MRPLPMLAALLVAVPALAVTPTPEARTATPADEIARRAAALAAEERLQTELPVDAGEQGTSAAFPDLEPRSSDGVTVRVPLGGSILVQALLWLVVAAAAIFATVRIALAVRASHRRQLSVPLEADAGPEGRRAGAAPADLAAEGRYPEAIHRLLLAVIERLASRIAGGLIPGHTAREVARAARLGGAARHGFDQIARAVERNLFAGEPLGREDWERCAAAHRELVEGLEGGR